MSLNPLLNNDIPPNQTLYVNNLNEKISLEQLKKSLYAIFSEYGQVVDIVAQKTLKKKGQAFVVFRDVNCAASALRSLQSFPFFEKPMRIQYAKEKSDVIAKMDGTYVPKDKRAGKNAAKAETTTKVEKVEKSEKTEKTFDMNTEPNYILFVQNLPSDTTEEKLKRLFVQFPGFVEVRVVPGRHDIAFVEFTSDIEAGSARNALQGFKISPTHSIVISFAKK